MFKIKNPVVPIFLLLTVSMYIFLMVASCKNGGTDSGKKPVTIQFPTDHSGLDSIEHFISEENIKVYKQDFQNDSFITKIPSLLVPEAEAFNKRGLLSLLQADDCVGIRIYHGVKTIKGGRNELRLILVGVNSKGDDILIDKSSVIAARLTANLGGMQSGQCPPCATSAQR